MQQGSKEHRESEKMRPSEAQGDGAEGSKRQETKETKETCAEACR